MEKQRSKRVSNSKTYKSKTYKSKTHKSKTHKKKQWGGYDWRNESKSPSRSASGIKHSTRSSTRSKK